MTAPEPVPPAAIGGGLPWPVAAVVAANKALTALAERHSMDFLAAYPTHITTAVLEAAAPLLAAEVRRACEDQFKTRMDAWQASMAEVVAKAIAGEREACARLAEFWGAAVPPELETDLPDGFHPFAGVIRARQP